MPRGVTASVPVTPNITSSEETGSNPTWQEFEMSRSIAASWIPHSSAPSRPHLQVTPKLVFDMALAGTALLLLLPVLLLVAIAIRLESKGPILFSQVRYGWDNRPFRVYKFRSMWMHMSDARGTKQARKDDPRVTPLGAFLRKTNIDELPQLWNVIKGDMSLVGPRPHAVGTCLLYT